MHIENIETSHGYVVHDVKMDYNGQRLATASSDTTVKIIGMSNTSTLKPLVTLTGHRGPVWQVAWGHPKFGSILASCSKEGRVIIWKEENHNEWKEFPVFSEHKSAVNCISWAPHELGFCLACGSSNGSISILTFLPNGGWDTSTIDQAHPGGVTSLSWVSPTSLEALHESRLQNPVHKLASGGCDNSVKLWKLCSGSWKMDCFPEVQMHPDSERDSGSTPNVRPPKTAIPSISADVSPGEARPTRWQLEEDELLIRAWLDSYKDPSVANDQKVPALWNRVAVHFEESRRGGILRTGTMLKKRWYRINLPVKKFIECYNQAYQQCETESERDKKDVTARAHRLYSSQNDGCRFNFVHAWILLRDEPKWKAYVNILSCDDCSNYTKVFEADASMSSSNLFTLTTSVVPNILRSIRDTGSSEVCDMIPMAGSYLSNPFHKLDSTGCDNIVKACDVYDGTHKTIPNMPEIRDIGSFERCDVAGPPNVGLTKSTIPSPLEGDASLGDGRHNRWQHEEDELMIRAWINVSNDPTGGNDQKMVTFWDQVKEHFEENRKGGVLRRTCAQLQKRWHRVSKAVKIFFECYDQACRQCHDEMSEEDILARAHRLYRFENEDCRFYLEHAWVLLKDEPTWRAYVNLSSIDGCTKRMKVSESMGVCMSSSSPDMPKGKEIGGSPEVCDINFVAKPLESKVGGLRKCEGKSKGALTKELQGIKSAEMKKATALEELSRTKQMELDMQIIYKATSSMDKEQLQFHVQLVQRLKRKYLL